MESSTMKLGRDFRTVKNMKHISLISFYVKGAPAITSVQSEPPRGLAIANRMLAMVLTFIRCEVPTLAFGFSGYITGKLILRCFSCSCW